MTKNVILILLFLSTLFAGGCSNLLFVRRFMVGIIYLRSINIKQLTPEEEARNIALQKIDDFNGIGRCKRCWWPEMKFHITPYGKWPNTEEPMRLYSPLCEWCWRHLKTPAKRMSYYREFWMGWENNPITPRLPGTWEELKLSVMMGM